MAAGYSLTADTREECLFLLHGTGRNGKGTYLKLLAAILGEYAGTADFSTFVATRDDRAPRDDVANMHGKRFIAAQESREGAALAESLIKWLTGGDAVRARRLYENSWEFDPTHKLWLATNHKPIIRGTDPAIWSRIRLIPFDVSFEGKEDRTLKTALMDELPGILAWAIEGCLRWQEEGLPLSASVEKATREYRDESDQLGRFIEERCIVGEFVSVLGRVLYSSYKTWAHDAGEPDLTETAFGRRMTEKGFQKRHTDRGKSYSGIALRSENN
jgi:putative DNA primase/helicase